MALRIKSVGGIAHRSKAFGKERSQKTSRRNANAVKLTRLALPEPLYQLVKAYAEEHDLYYGEATAHLVSVGLCGVYGWDTDTGIARQYYPFKLPKIEKVDHRVSIAELVTMEAARKVIDRGCPPRDVMISADKYPLLRTWAENMGVKWEAGMKIDIDFPKEFDE
jgi:hypothetical protein